MANSDVNFPSTNSVLSSARAAELNALDDWALILALVAYSSDTPLTYEEKDVVRALADGFGDISRPISGVSELSRSDMLRDWSHIRDSSDAAVARMAGALRAWVASKTRCGTCGGSGAVHPHPTALCAVSCPDCSGL